MAGVASSLQAQVLYDLSSGANSVLINGGYIMLNVAPNVTYTGGTGSGNFNSFLRLQETPADPNNEEGFNTAYNPNTDVPTSDTKAGISLQPNALVANTISGSPPPGTLPANTYFVFGMDGQEAPGGGGTRISVDEISLYYSSTLIETIPGFPVANPGAAADTAKLAFIRNKGTLIWSTDYNAANEPANTTVLVDYQIVSGGNGNADIIFAVPKPLFPTGTQYIYLVGRIGFTTTVLLFNTLVDFQADSSFEEFGLVPNAQLTPPPPADPIPEASTWAAMLGMTGVAGLTLLRRSRRAQAVAALN